MERLKGIIVRVLSANPRTLWRRYVVALFLLVAFYVGGHLVAMSVLHIVDSDTKIGVLTARQETLNQRIIVSALRLSSERDNIAERRALGAMIDEFESAHMVILDGAGDPAMKPLSSQRLRPLFYEDTLEGPSLNHLIGKFVIAARTIQANTFKTDAEFEDCIETMVSLNLFSRLESATNVFKLDSIDRVEKVHMVHATILVAGLLTIFLEFCLIFWPGHIIAQNALRRLGERSEELSASNERLEESLVEAREARLEADQSNRAKSMFLANMSHELRTPLNAIIGFSSMIRAEIFGKVGHDRYVEYSDDIERSGQQLLELIGDLMDISQIEVGTAQFDRRDFCVAELMEEVEPLARGWPLARERDIRFDVQNARERFYGDPLRLRQILLNLLSNAIKFTRTGDTISVTAKSHSDGGLRFIVEDSGQGFDVDDIETLKQPFQRGDNAFTRDRDGVGLGLSLVAAFTAMHKGSVALENVDTGGARIVVTLPRVSAFDHALSEVA